MQHSSKRLPTAAVTFVLIFALSCHELGKPAVVETQAPAPIQVGAILAAPVLTEPKCGIGGIWPESLTLAWNPVEGAASYTVEIDCMNCSDHPDPWFSEAGAPWRIREDLNLSYKADDIIATLRKMGDRTMMRWRAWAVDANGTKGRTSDWCFAAFTEHGLPTPSTGTP